MHLIPPQPSRKKWGIRLTLPDGRIVKFRGDADRAIALQTGTRIQMLARAKGCGDAPPPELRQWLANIDRRLADRLVRLGLAQPHHLGRAAPLSEWIAPWAKVVGERRPDSKAGHSADQQSKVRRIIDALGATRLDHLDPDKVTETINAFRTAGKREPTPLSGGSRRSYSIAIRDFAHWLSGKLRTENPLQRMELPSASEDVVYERQPLTVEEFRRLMSYLDTFERYPGQKARWNASDRKMLYWVAVKSGYRQRELSLLRRWNLHLDREPAVITLKAEHTKNRENGQVPIPRDLAVALAKYVEGHDPDQRVFRFPTTSGSIVDILRRDLEGAGVEWRRPGGEVVDFHALRSTAITWWLDEDHLSLKKVQAMARLKTLALVQRYSRKYRMTEFDWLDKGPKLV